MQAPGKLVSKIPPVVFEQEELSRGKMVGLFGALATLGVFAYAPAAEAFGGTSSVALLFVALSLGLGGISRQTFNSYNWHLLFLIGGGSALGQGETYRLGGWVGSWTKTVKKSKTAGIIRDPICPLNSFWRGHLVEAWRFKKAAF